MAVRNETKWLCENARNLEKFSGQWVMFSVNEGVVGSGPSLQKVLTAARKSRVADPFVFHVPSKRDLGNPFALALKK